MATIKLTLALAEPRKMEHTNLNSELHPLKSLKTLPLVIQ